jgi:hypothetical protein
MRILATERGKAMKQEKRLLPVLLVIAGLTLPVAGQAVPVQAGGEQTTEATRRMTLKHSGLFSTKKTVIEYRPGDRTIVSVRENGRQVAEEDLDPYQRMLHEALEVSDLEELIPDLDAANEAFGIRGLSGLEDIEELDAVMGRLGEMESDFARVQLELLEARQKLARYRLFMDALNEELEKSDVDAWGYEIEITDGWLLVDGKRVPRDLSERCIALFEEITDEKVQSNGTTIQWEGD